MSCEDRIEEADQELDEAYENALEAIETAGNLSKDVEQRLDTMYSETELQIAQYKKELRKGIRSLEEDNPDTSEATDYLESAGQALVNASYVSTALMNKAESAVYNGDEAFESEVSRISLGAVSSESKATGLIKDAATQKVGAFEGYDEVLQDVAGDVIEIDREKGINWSIDIGLGQQHPDIEL